MIKIEYGELWHVELDGNNRWFDSEQLKEYLSGLDTNDLLRVTADSGDITAFFQDQLEKDLSKNLFAPIDDRVKESLCDSLMRAAGPLCESVTARVNPSNGEIDVQVKMHQAAKQIMFDMKVTEP